MWEFFPIYGSLFVFPHKVLMLRKFKSNLLKYLLKVGTRVWSHAKLLLIYLLPAEHPIPQQNTIRNYVPKCEKRGLVRIVCFVVEHHKFFRINLFVFASRNFVVSDARASSLRELARPAFAIKFRFACRAPVHLPAGEREQKSRWNKATESSNEWKQTIDFSERKTFSRDFYQQLALVSSWKFERLFTAVICVYGAVVGSFLRQTDAIVINTSQGG